jgi:alpha-D-xyloside xylohydrolase
MKITNGNWFLRDGVKATHPPLLDEKEVDVVRALAELKARLMPYPHHAALHAATDGTPMMRAMPLKFPAEPACAYLERQHVLGENPVVTAEFSGSGEVSFSAPEGAWAYFFTGVEGTHWPVDNDDIRLHHGTIAGAVEHSSPARRRR